MLVFKIFKYDDNSSWNSKVLIVIQQKEQKLLILAFLNGTLETVLKLKIIIGIK